LTFQIFQAKSSEFEISKSRSQLLIKVFIIAYPTVRPEQLIGYIGYRLYRITEHRGFSTAARLGMMALHVLKIDH